MARIGTNMNVAVQTALATGAITVTALTQANPGVATASSHGLATGDVVVFSVDAGMVELDGQAVEAVPTTTSQFQLRGLDTTNYSAWSAGTCTEVTTFSTIQSAQNVSMPNPAPEKIDITRLIDKVKQYAYGLADAPDGTISGLYDPNDTAVAEIKTATANNATRVFKVTWAGGQKTIFNANVSGGTGFDLQQNQAATADISFTPVGQVVDYAS